MTAPTLLRYVGVDRGGVSRTGALDPSATDLPGWVARRYRARWRELVVRRGEDVVGEIGPSYGRGGRRIWWAES